MELHFQSCFIFDCSPTQWTFLKDQFSTNLKGNSSLLSVEIRYLYAVKMVHIIIAFYIVFLDLRPCDDVNTCLDEQRAGISISVTDTHDHNSAEQDLCSPFCVCSCCASHLQIRYSAVISSNLCACPSPQPLLYLSNALPTTGQSIWQPPKV